MKEMEFSGLERAATGCVFQKAVHQLAVVQTGVPTSKFFFRPIMQRMLEVFSNIFRIFSHLWHLQGNWEICLLIHCKQHTPEDAPNLPEDATHRGKIYWRILPTSCKDKGHLTTIDDCGSNKIYNRDTWELTEVAYKLLEPVSLNNIRYFTETVLEALRFEVLNSGKMHSIEEILQLEHECKAEGTALVKETLKYSTDVATLEHNIKKVTLNSQEEINQKDIQLAMLQDDLLDLQYHKQVSLGFTEQRIGAKMGQVSLWLQDHEHTLAQTIDFNIVACDLQDRVHVEILNYLDCVIQDLQELVKYWTEHSKTEMAEMNIRLNKLQQVRCEQSNQLQNLAALYKNHQEEMKSYCEERMAREHKQEMQQRISEMATKIQAWWRGTMVRRHLGPFKVDKKKKPKDKPKKKK